MQMPYSVLQASFEWLTRHAFRESRHSLQLFCGAAPAELLMLKLIRSTAIAPKIRMASSRSGARGQRGKQLVSVAPANGIHEGVDIAGGLGAEIHVIGV